jgi:hypothetical protein
MGTPVAATPETVAAGVLLLPPPPPPQPTNPAAMKNDAISVAKMLDRPPIAHLHINFIKYYQQHLLLQGSGDVQLNATMATK